MTDQTREILRREHRETRWTHALVRAAFLVGIPLFVAYQATTFIARPGVRELIGTAILGALAIAAVVVLWLTVRHRSAEGEIERDLRASLYLRTTGCVLSAYVGDTESGRFELYVDEQRLRSPWGPKAPPFTKLDGATVDHTPHAQVVFAIVDAEGWIAYIAPGYKAPPA